MGAIRAVEAVDSWERRIHGVGRDDWERWSGEIRRFNHHISSRSASSCQSVASTSVGLTRITCAGPSHTTTATYCERSPKVHRLVANLPACPQRRGCSSSIWRLECPFDAGCAECRCHVHHLRGCPPLGGSSSTTPLLNLPFAL
jgi:hypothetical protein